mmetsp:Transcript_17773/g.45963  ORF Transcript_17773/g.45963 Transcript_17773/m.45963 type:complete len:535 (+) Transcript_17773:30-1634(+)
MARQARREARHARHAAKWQAKHDPASAPSGTAASTPAPASHAHVHTWPPARAEDSALCAGGDATLSTDADAVVHIKSGEPTSGRHRRGHVVMSEHAGRPYLLRVPSSAPASGAPLLLLAPASAQSAVMTLELMSARELAADHGFVVAVLEPATRGDRLVVPVSPDKADEHEHGHVDDVQYARAVIEDVGARTCVDGERVVCAGLSRGGRFCSSLASQPGVRLAGVVAVGGIRAYAPPPAGAVAVLAIHAYDDPTNPYVGGGHSYWKWQSVPAAVSAWARFDGCAATCERSVAGGTFGLSTEQASLLDLQLHTRCERDAAVALLSVRGLGHNWPTWAGRVLAQFMLGVRANETEPVPLGWAQRQEWACDTHTHTEQKHSQPSASAGSAGMELGGNGGVVDILAPLESARAPPPGPPVGAPPPPPEYGAWRALATPHADAAAAGGASDATAGIVAMAASSVLASVIVIAALVVVIRVGAPGVGRVGRRRDQRHAKVLEARPPASPQPQPSPHRSSAPALAAALDELSGASYESAQS